MPESALNPGHKRKCRESGFVQPLQAAVLCFVFNGSLSRQPSFGAGSKLFELRLLPSTPAHAQGKTVFALFLALDDALLE